MDTINYITKTIYLDYLKCAKNSWLKVYKPDLFESLIASDYEKHLAEQGAEVEQWAQKLFPGGVDIGKLKGDSNINTLDLVQQKTKYIFQPTFIFDKFLARNDVLAYNSEVDAWNLYEIKSSNTLEENGKNIDHIEDASFQYVVLQNQAIKVGKVFVVHLNNEYIRNGDIEINNLFTIEDITDRIKERQHSTLFKMQQAKIDLLQTNEDVIDCSCLYRGRSAQCETFSYTHNQVPAYSVHDLVRIGSSKKRLIELVDRGIFHIDDVPSDFPLSESQKNQIKAYLLGKPLINNSLIKAELDKLIFPLYFLDYESYAAAIPLFNGFKPYQQIPFQFSLHRIDSVRGNLVHKEHLHISASDPSIDIINKLREFIGPKGNIIVWYKGFEQMINSELGKRHPEHAEFLSDLNNRIYDLMEIFSKQMYVHPGFRGKTSIKKVLPVLIPELNYSGLGIKDGAKASQSWFDMIFTCLSEDEQKQIADDLRKYCDLDTYAMYALWNFLIINCSEHSMHFELSHASSQPKQIPINN